MRTGDIAGQCRLRRRPAPPAPARARSAARGYRGGMGHRKTGRHLFHRRGGRPAAGWLPLVAAAVALAGPTGRLEGEVRAPDTRPVPGATVAAFRAGPHPAVALTATDGTGAFRLDRLPAGRYDVEVGGSGRGARVRVEGVEVAPPFRSVLDLTLEGPPAETERVRRLGGGDEAPRITVRLTDEDGRPLPRGWLRLSPHAHRADPLLVRTDERGEGAGGPLAPGPYRIAAGRAGYLTLEVGPLEWGGTLAVHVRLLPAPAGRRPPLDTLVPPPRFLPPRAPEGEPPGEGPGGTAK
ncbi:MAG: carboxypeptidase regulatory-like domain-containing protein [Acidobacteria bacterium]|nr:MAG: carboxypeptidase regulatory-like domain-containing protein [Acidobacteriota bacterium]